MWENMGNVSRVRGWGKGGACLFPVLRRVEAEESGIQAHFPLRKESEAKAGLPLISVLRRQREVDLCELETSLVYMSLSSRTAKATK